MNQQMAQRIIWKEYRMQRSMWVFLFGIATAIQVLVAILADPRESLDMQLAMGWGATFFFAVVAGSVTFSPECEEGTQVRLLSLKTSPFWTVTLKAVCVVTGTVVLLLAVASTASLLAMKPVWQSSFFDIDPGNVNAPLYRSVSLSMIVAGGSIFGMFFSLILTRTLLAVTCAAMSTFFCTMFFIELASNHKEGTSAYFVLPAAVLAGLSTVNYALSASWFRGLKLHSNPFKLLAARFIPRRVTDGQNAIATYAAGETTSGVQPAANRQLSKLYAHQDSRVRTQFRFLRWKEAAESRRSFLIATIAIVALTALFAEFSKRNAPHWNFFNASIFFMATTAAGLCTFHGEQHAKSFRFLCHRGVSPSLVWLSKITIWLPRLIAVWATSFLLIGAVSSTLSMTTYLTSCSLSAHLDEHSAGGTVSLIGRTMLVGLMLYSVGQMASICFQKPLVRLFVAFVGGMTLLFWYTFTHHYGVPTYLSTLPIIPTMFGISWARSRSWMLELRDRRSWKASRRIAFGGIATCCVLSMWFRSIEVPLSLPLKVKGSVNGLTPEQSNALFSNVSADEKTTADLIREASKKYVHPVSMHEGSTTDRWLSANATNLELLNSAASRPRCAFDCPGLRVTDQPQLLRSELIELLLAQARKHQHNGEFESALTQLLNALKLQRHLEGRGSQRAYTLGTHDLIIICDAIRGWAAEVRVSESLRMQADAALEKFETSQVTLAEIAAIEYRRINNQLVAWARGKTADLPGAQTAWVLQWSWLPGEGMRRTRLLAYLHNQDAFRINAFHVTGNPNSLASPAPFNSDIEIRRVDHWLQCSPLLSLLDRPEIATCFEFAVMRATEINATRLLLRIHNHRKRTGRWPVSINELGTDVTTQKVAQDPWTRRRFVWMPNGITHALELGDELEIPPSEAFLLSGGPGKGRLVLELSGNTAQSPRYLIQYESPNQTARLFLMPQ